MSFKIAVQLYTVRDLLDANPVKTLAAVREIGYTRVELAGLGSHSASQMKAMLDDEGLTPVAMHSPIQELEGALNRAIDAVKTLGIAHLVCPWLPDDRRPDEAGWKQCAESLNRIGEQCRAQGVRLSYHNHSFEFVRCGDRYGLDLLFDESDPANLAAELDTYWIRDGGEDPAAYIRKYVKRCPLIHLKDMTAGDKPTFAEVGTGTLNFDEIFHAMAAAGCEYGIIEQDICPGDPLVSIRKSLDFLKSKGLS